MKTEIIKVHPEFPERDKIIRCAKVIRQRGLVIFPTETVYGIAADVNNPEAMKRLRQVKQRSEGKPFSILIAQKELITNYTPVRDPRVFKLADRFWPGPLTIILPSAEEGKTVGIRMPDHPVALTFVRESQCTIAAPSANAEGNPAPATCAEALRDMEGLVDLALDAGPAQIGQSSTVVDMTQGKPVVVRQGKIGQTEIDETVSKKLVLIICTGNSCRSVMAEYLLRQKLKGRQDIEVASAGTSVFLTAMASSGALKVLRERGIDASGHRSSPMTNILLHKADLILVMTQQHRQAVLRLVPDVEKRVYLLKEFSSEPIASGTDLDIPDPIGLSDSAYQDCVITINAALEKLVGLL